MLVFQIKERYPIKEHHPIKKAVYGFRISFSFSKYPFFSKQNSLDDFLLHMIIQMSTDRSFPDYFEPMALVQFSSLRVLLIAT